MLRARMAALRGWLAALAVLSLAWALTAWRFAAPAPVPAGAPPGEFSAERAAALLEELLGDEAPHPVGSAAADRIRERLLLRLERLGLTPEVQAGLGCSRRGPCSHLANVVATIPGREGDEAVLLAAHYDSVAAGPGAADDGAGVAALLEVARALKARRPPRRTVVLLFSDGEEADLLGARLFMREHPLAPRIRVAVNLEARGSSGPSLMFETAGPTAPLARWLTALPRPLSSSLFSAVYERLPNDTDFSVFRQHGIAGFNFAFIEDVAHYHTPLDDLGHLSRASLQHHGENALALVTVLADTQLDRLEDGGEAVWFDWLGGPVVRWPLGWSLPLAAGAAIALLVLLGLWARRGGARPVLLGALKSAGIALGAWLGALAVGAGGMALVDLREGTPWYAHPEPARMALTAAGLLACAIGGAALRRVPLPTRFLGIWMLWAALGVAIAALFPQASHLFIAPTWIAAALGALTAALGVHGFERLRLALGLVPAFVAATLWLRVAEGLEAAVGLDAHPAIALALALPISSALPAFAEIDGDARQLGAMVPGAVWALATIAALVVPAYSAERPQRLSIAHLQVDGEAHWLVDSTWGPVPDALASAAGIERELAAPLPYVSFQSVGAGPAPAIDAAPPTVERVHAEAGTLRVRVRSLRGARMTGLLVPPDAPLISAEVGGRSMPIARLPGSSPWYAGHRLVTHLTTPADGVLIELRFAGEPPERLGVLDVVYELPAVEAPLVKARGARGTPSQNGDLSIIARSMQL